MMPVGPPAHLPPPYRPKWQPLPAQVPSPPAQPTAAPSVLPQTPSTVPVLAVKAESLSDSEDLKPLSIKPEPVVCLPVVAEAEGEGEGANGPLRGCLSSSRQLDRKERVRRFVSPALDMCPG